MLQAGGPDWEVPLGRRDSTGASISGSNNDIPAPNNTFQTILSRFNSKGLDLVDLVALSGLYPYTFFFYIIFFLSLAVYSHVQIKVVYTTRHNFPRALYIYSIFYLIIFSY